MVSTRTRLVSAAERGTLFESPVPVAISRVMNVRTDIDIPPKLSNIALTICICICAARLLLVTAENMRGRFNESTPTATEAITADGRIMASERTTPRRPAGDREGSTRQIVSEGARSDKLSATVAVPQASDNKQHRNEAPLQSLRVGFKG